MAIAREISKSSKKLFAIVVLTGARTFFNDLNRALEYNGVAVEYDEIKLNSYSGTQSTGKVSIQMDVSKDIEGKNVFIIEDIIDTGRTISFLKDYLLHEKKASSVKICALFDKPSRREVKIKIDYAGFEVPNEFIVGFGMDYKGKYRELPFVGVLRER